MQVSIDPNVSDRLTDAQDKAQPVKHFPATKNVVVHKATAVRLVFRTSALYHIVLSWSEIRKAEDSKARTDLSKQYLVRNVSSSEGLV